MSVTNADLQEYVGGQMEFQNTTEGYLCRGEIAEINLDPQNFSVRFAWLIMRKGKPPLYAGDWEVQQELEYAVSSAVMFSIQKSPGGPGDPDRVIIESGVSDELIVLFHKDKESLFDPTTVPGLVTRA